jgi:large conductance mechanosensitive channel
MQNNVSFVSEFIEFVKKYGVIGLAIGFVTGTAASDFVKILSTNILTPLVGWMINLFGQDAFVKMNVNIGSGVTLGFGNVLSGLITFLSVMAFIFVLVKFVINKFMTDADHKSV